MRRYRQTLEEIVNSLSMLEASWEDAHSEAVIELINHIPDKKTYRLEDIALLLDANFQAGLTTIRLALDLSKDQFSLDLRDSLGKGGAGIQRYQKERRFFLEAMVGLGACKAIARLASTPVSWRNILVERLKSGRGSAIKGQARGRALEDFTEQIVKCVFSEYDVRCRFFGATGESTEKADFAIPTKSDPSILIESKAYGATGSKQTDILGDIARITEEKRPDTDLLLVTDGLTWRERSNDLRKLVTMQNRGLIRILTDKCAFEVVGMTDGLDHMVF